jgi:hypothetical protein
MRLAHLTGQAVPLDIGERRFPGRELEAYLLERVSAADPADQVIGLLPAYRSKFEHPTLAQAGCGGGWVI